MNAADNHLVQLLTGKPSVHEASVEELKALITRYPYFSLGQLLLTQKLKQDQSANFADQLQHCAVYFQDTAWLEGKLYDEGKSTAKASRPTADESFSAPLITKKKESAPAIAPENEAAENTNLITLPAKDVLDDFTLQMDDVKDEPELPPLDEDELEPTDDETAMESAAKIADVLQHQVEDFKAPVKEEAKLTAGAEPFHTIDYFASQGIKADSQAQDAFTKKVHTFTDWLKQMKRISHYPTDLGSDPDMENFVQTIADTSNQQKAVDTEAMAEVLVKQGKLDKAIEVYEKLSLLNPGKTAYFAAKINHLKAS